jgi:hypothetical protein
MPTDITNVDFSKASVQAMRERNIGRELMTCIHTHVQLSVTGTPCMIVSAGHHMDVKELDEQVCPDETFDIVFDKGEQLHRCFSVVSWIWCRLLGLHDGDGPVSDGTHIST